MNLLIISASMGAGHDGAARELQRRLEAEGHHAEVRDYLGAFPLWIGTIIRVVYQLELRYAPWTYDQTYRMWESNPRMKRPLAWLLMLVTWWRVKRWIRDADAAAVLSTYPLASLTLGRARRRGKLAVPTSTYITDFCVHPLWTHPGIDLHIAVHPQSADEAHQQSHGPASAPGPLVSERFRSHLPSRAAARLSLGIPADERVVLLVAGSWGVGAVERTFDDVLATDRWTPLVVCGHNDALREALAGRGRGRVMGWTDRMPDLMAAADVLMENAGGLTAMEAFAAGLPVVSYRPIAGHGKGNARDMQTAGVATLATPESLADTLDAMLGAEGVERREAGLAMFAGDAATDFVDLGRAGVAAARVIAARSRRSRARRPAAVAGACVASLALGVTLTSVGASIAAAHGVAVAKPPRHATQAYVAVRIGEAAAADPRVPAALAADHVTAIVSGLMAASDPSVVARLASNGVDVANGGWGQHRGHSVTWARADVMRAGHAISQATGDPVHQFVPGRRVDGFALASAEWSNQQVVLSRNVIQGADLPVLRIGAVYIVDVRTLSPAGVLGVLDKIGAAERDGLSIAPLAALRDPE